MPNSKCSFFKEPKTTIAIVTRKFIYSSDCPHCGTINEFEESGQFVVEKKSFYTHCLKCGKKYKGVC